MHDHALVQGLPPKFHCFRLKWVSCSAELPGMLLAAVIVEIFSRKRTLAAGLLITGVCTAALIASPAQVGTLGAQTVLSQHRGDSMRVQIPVFTAVC